jgi:nitroreductase
MNIDQLIQSRRSVFPAQFAGGLLNDTDIERLLKNANWAPTHLHTEPWRFMVFSGESMESLMHFLAGLYKEITLPEHFSLAKFEKYTERMAKTSHVIAIGMARHENTGIPEEEEIAAVAMAVQNMWLTLADIPGAGGYWSSGSLVYTPQMEEYLGWSPEVRCLGLFYLGKVDPAKPHAEGKRKPWEEKVIWKK